MPSFQQITKIDTRQHIQSHETKQNDVQQFWNNQTVNLRRLWLSYEELNSKKLTPCRNIWVTSADTEALRFKRKFWKSKSSRWKLPLMGSSVERARQRKEQVSLKAASQRKEQVSLKSCQPKLWNTEKRQEIKGQNRQELWNNQKSVASAHGKQQRRKEPEQQWLRILQS